MQKTLWMALFVFICCLLSPCYAVQQAGKVQLIMMPAQGVQEEQLVTWLQQDGRFKKIADSLNNALRFPHNLTIRFVSKGMPHYIPRQYEIQIPYEYIMATALIFKKYYGGETAAYHEYVLHNVQFVLYHELAHALIDLYELPVLGNEEGAADTLAVLVALEYLDNGYELILDVADFFSILNLRKQNNYKVSDLWDEHSLTIQRYYNIMCLTYAKFPARIQKQVNTESTQDLADMIKVKGSYCQNTYRKEIYSWNKLLQPYDKGLHLKAEYRK
jgi:hypothetical protein